MRTQNEFISEMSSEIMIERAEKFFKVFCIHQLLSDYVRENKFFVAWRHNDWVVKIAKEVLPSIVNT